VKIFVGSLDQNNDGNIEYNEFSQFLIPKFNWKLANQIKTKPLRYNKDPQSMNRKTERILSSLIILHSDFERKCLEKLGSIQNGSEKYRLFLFNQIDLQNQGFIDIKK
jgi:Ca2+-binding EF-hand superfamily protein